MLDARLALLVLLALGLGTYAGLHEAQRDGESHRSEAGARLSTPGAETVEGGASGSSRAFAPQRVRGEGGQAPRGPETSAEAAPLPDLERWRGSRASLEAWIRREIARWTRAAPGTSKAVRLTRLRDLLARILEEGTADPDAPRGWPRPPRPRRPFPSRPWRGDEPDDRSLPAGSGVW